MDRIGKIITLPVNRQSSQGSTPESEKSTTLTMRAHSEPYDVPANIERILSCRGVPDSFLKSRMVDIPEDIQRDVTSSKKEGFFIQGICGVGKTHLAVAIMRRALIENSKGAYRVDTCVRGIYDARFIPVTSLLLRIKAAFGQEARESEAEIISRVSDVDLLVLDDLGSEKASDWVLQTIYTIMDIRSREGKPIIITSNLDLDGIAKKLSDRVSSRIAGMCEIIALAGKDRRLSRG